MRVSAVQEDCTTAAALSNGQDFNSKQWLCASCDAQSCVVSTIELCLYFHSPDIMHVIES